MNTTPQSKVADLSPERREILRRYAESCYERYMMLKENFGPPHWDPLPRNLWVANCMQSALSSIGTTDAWERIEQVAKHWNPDSQ